MSQYVQCRWRVDKIVQSNGGKKRVNANEEHVSCNTNVFSQDFYCLVVATKAPRASRVPKKKDQVIECKR